MYRVDNSTAVPHASGVPAPQPVGPNVNGYFTRGNPGTGTPATIVDDDWANAIQEEIAGVIESAPSSQTLSKTLRNQLLGAIAFGRLLNVQNFTTAGTFTYTPTAGTKSVVVEVQGGGAAGGGCPITVANGESIGTPGTSGAYALSRFTSSFSGVTVTVGAKGLGVGGSGGQNGLTSSFGALVSCPGGLGGGSSTAAAAGVPLSGGNGGVVNPTGANIFPGSSDGGGQSISIGLSCAFGGAGGRTPKGGGGVGANINTNGSNAVTPGAGGSGTANFNNGVSAPTGGNGADGYVIVWEFG